MASKDAVRSEVLEFVKNGTPTTHREKMDAKDSSNKANDTKAITKEYILHQIFANVGDLIDGR